MTKLSLHPTEIHRWFSDDGDNTHILNYDLNENSKVMDLGAFVGIWAEKVINKYNPYIYLIEPIPQFYDQLVSKFNKNSKVSLMRSAVGENNKSGFIYLNGDASSSNSTNETSTRVEYNTINNIFKYFSIDKLDLLQINIEGDEYELLENMFKTNVIHNIKNIQIQFHMGVENDIKKRQFIQQEFIKNNFQLKYNYDFVWESWTKC
jgi:FkbM family methyltransferase